MNDETPFTLPPAGMLSEQIDLPDHRLSLGLMHRDGEGVRVFTWDGERLRHLTADAAQAYADFIDENPHAAVLKPVSDALRVLAGKINDLESAAMFRRVSATVMRKFTERAADADAFYDSEQDQADAAIDWNDDLADMTVEGHA